MEQCHAAKVEHDYRKDNTINKTMGKHHIAANFIESQWKFPSNNEKLKQNNNILKDTIEENYRK